MEKKKGIITDLLFQGLNTPTLCTSKKCRREDYGTLGDTRWEGCGGGCVCVRLTRMYKRPLVE